MHFLRLTRLWILLLPIAFTFTGAASNQLVLAANHDKFPVMVNERKLREFEQHDRQDQNVIQALGSLVGIDIQAPPVNDDGMLDDVHCVMTSATHLNFLADWIDLPEATYSPGDLLLELGDWSMNYAPLLWGFLLCSDALRRKEV